MARKPGAKWSNRARGTASLPRAVCGRARGFKGWVPTARSLLLLENVAAVLEQYREHLPVTLRQVFYRLVAAYGLEKTEKSYQSLTEKLNRARRAGLVPWDAIRDDGFHGGGHLGWESVAEFAATVRGWVDRYRIDRQIGQERRVALWCEAAGMVPQLERVAREFSVPVFSSGGFDSLTVKHQKAQHFAAMGDVLVLHVGDHDPSGVHVFASLDEDVGAFVRRMGGSVQFERLAVLPDHVERYGLETAPPKATDRRACHGETVQAEAIPPDVLAGVVRRAIVGNLDPDVMAAAVELERQQREQLGSWAAALDSIGGET